jgi:hypothetical protein
VLLAGWLAGVAGAQIASQKSSITKAKTQAKIRDVFHDVFFAPPIHAAHMGVAPYSP